MKTPNKKFKAFVSSLFAVALLCVVANTSAQSIDSDPPSINFEPVNEGINGDIQVFSATVTDNDLVESVTLYFRTDDSQNYQNRPMIPIGSTGLYSAQLGSGDINTDAELIQYYIEAIDKAGNRSLDGFSFDPFERALVDRTPVAVVEEEGLLSSLSLNQKIIYGALGVLVVGALMSASGGGGGSSPEVPVTISVDPLP